MERTKKKSPYVCLSVRMAGFAFNLMFENFSRKLTEKIQVSLKSDENDGNFTWRDVGIYSNVSLNSS
jgi:hypothetical protein